MGSVSGNFVKHNLDLAMEVLILGITRLKETDENYHERIIIRVTLVLLEFLSRSIDAQMEPASKCPDSKGGDGNG